MPVDFKIFDTIWPLEDTVGVEGTSQDVNFPASNLKNPIRAKVWHSSGFFVISATNKYLDFDDGGAEINVSLTEGTYSRDGLSAEIKAQMDGVGANTYTVSYGAGSGKWSIASSGATLNLLWATGTNTANTVGESLGFDTSSDDSGALSYTGADIALHTLERAIIDLKAGYTSTPVDSFALLFDPNRGNQFSEQATLTLKANNTKNFDSPAVSVAITVDDNHDVATHFFSATQSYRYWCLEIVDPHNPNLYVEVGTIILSKVTTLAQIPEIGFQYTITDQSKKTSNKYGIEYSDIYPNARALGFNWAVFTYADMETLADIYDRVGNTRPIAVSLDSSEQLFDAQRFFLYGKIKGNFKPKHKILTYFDNSMSIEEAF